MEDLRKAEKLLIKATQPDVFPEQLMRLHSSKTHCVLPRRDPLNKLDAFLDDGYGLLRVGGRLGTLALAYKENHPIIPPK